MPETIMADRSAHIFRSLHTQQLPRDSELLRERLNPQESRSEHDISDRHHSP